MEKWLTIPNRELVLISRFSTCVIAFGAPPEQISLMVKTWHRRSPHSDVVHLGGSAHSLRFRLQYDLLNI